MEEKQIPGMTPRDLLQGFFLVVFRRWRLILVLFAVGVLGLCGYLYLEYPLYKATVTILVHKNPRQQLILFRDMATPAEPDYKVTPADNLMEIVRSPGIAKQIVETFNLNARAQRRAESPDGVREWCWWVINKTLYLPIRLLEIVGILDVVPRDYTYEAVEEFLDERQEIERVMNTELLKVTVWEENPRQAAAIVNMLGQLVIDKTIALTQAKVSAAYQVTSEQEAAAGETLRRREEDLAREQSEQNLIGLDRQQELLLQRINQARKDLDGVTKAEQSLRARSAALEKQREGVATEIRSSRVIGENPVVREAKTALFATEMELASRSPELRSTHPEMGRLEARAKQAEKTLSEEDATVPESETMAANPLYLELTAQITAAQTDLESRAAEARALREQIDDLDAELRVLPEKKALLARLERDRKTQEDLYVNLTGKLAEMQVQQATRLGEFDIRIVDEAYLSAGARHDWPEWKYSLLIGIPSSLALALLLTFLVNYFDETYVTPRPLERDLRIPVLSCVPKTAADAAEAT
jgi:uncharacterized protein involved in exopolysaccharide biosynthesis